MSDSFNINIIILFRVTVMKDAVSRKSKGVAFILYLNQEDAEKCVAETNEKEVFKLSIILFSKAYFKVITP